jgi:hypothetical protein
MEKIIDYSWKDPNAEFLSKKNNTHKTNRELIKLRERELHQSRGLFGVPPNPPRRA